LWRGDEYADSMVRAGRAGPSRTGGSEPDGRWSEPDEHGATGEPLTWLRAIENHPSQSAGRDLSAPRPSPDCAMDFPHAGDRNPQSEMNDDDSLTMQSSDCSSLVPLGTQLPAKLSFAGVMMAPSAISARQHTAAVQLHPQVTSQVQLGNEGTIMINTQKHPGIPRNTPEYPGIPKRKNCSVREASA